jgi:hypothetical protein
LIGPAIVTAKHPLFIGCEHRFSVAAVSNLASIAAVNVPRLLTVPYSSIGKSWKPVIPTSFSSCDNYGVGGRERTKYQKLWQISLGSPSKLGFGLSPSSTPFGDPLEKPGVFIETPRTTRALETEEFSVFLLDAF